MAEPKPCSVEGCRKPQRERGWCTMHYTRWRRHSDPLYVPLSGADTKRCPNCGKDKPATTEFFAPRRCLTETTGIIHEVDHIVPLHGRTVSGLHVETNLQVIPKSVNRQKSNRY
ncbi:MAG: hypothetical protein ACREE4_23275 [Stellaceae bacterium]